MLDVLALARAEGAMVMVHAENHDVIGWLSDRLATAGHTAPKFHGVAHAAVAEREATHRAISLAELLDAHARDDAGGELTVMAGDVTTTSTEGCDVS